MSKPYFYLLTEDRKDFHAIAELYQHLNPEDPVIDLDNGFEHWRHMQAQSFMFFPAVKLNGQVVSTCVLSIIPNLSRNMQPYALIENVVTHGNFRSKGLGQFLLKNTCQIAWDHHCYKIMLQTGSQKPSTHHFYEKSGFVSGTKTAFICYSPRKP